MIGWWKTPSEEVVTHHPDELWHLGPAEETETGSEEATLQDVTLGVSKVRRGGHMQPFAGI